MTQTPKNINILEELSRVIEIEAEALEAVRQNLGEPYVRAVELIAASSGQVFVTGMGKSGIIANKIAATLRSTGTPAIFLHAGDALHGDIGMIRPSDVVLAIGKSGETGELNSLLRALRGAGTPIICMTSNAASAMAGLSDIVLDLPVPREACPLNLAPTASTTAALAVGDAIAVALMKLKDISEEDFARHHPAGQLGARLLLRANDVMRKDQDNPIVDVDQPVKEMLLRITAFKAGAISVVDQAGKLIGLVTDYDIRRALENDRNIFAMSIREIMNANPATVHIDLKAVDILQFMRERGKPFSVMPVIDSDRRAVGMIHLHDLVSAGL